jgi:hypothetical protein
MPLRQFHRRADAHQAAWLGGNALDRFARRLRLRDHVLRVPVHVLADLGDRELARRALQQAHAEVRLQLRDAPAQPRLRDAERALGGGIAAMLDHAGEELQVVEVGRVHSMRSSPPM